MIGVNDPVFIHKLRFSLLLFLFYLTLFLSILLILSVRAQTTFPPTPGRPSTPPPPTTFPPTTTPKVPVFVTNTDGQLVTDAFGQPVTYFPTKPPVGPAVGDEDDDLALSKGKQQLR